MRLQVRRRPAPARPRGPPAPGAKAKRPGRNLLNSHGGQFAKQPTAAIEECEADGRSGAGPQNHPRGDHAGGRHEAGHRRNVRKRRRWKTHRNQRARRGLNRGPAICDNTRHDSSSFKGAEPEAIRLFVKGFCEAPARSHPIRPRASRTRCCWRVLRAFAALAAAGPRRTGTPARCSRGRVGRRPGRKTG